MQHPRFEEMTRGHVIRAAQAIAQPRSIQKWGCVVEVNGQEREFPVKQLFMEAANQVASPAPLEQRRRRHRKRHRSASLTISESGEGGEIRTERYDFIETFFGEERRRLWFCRRRFLQPLHVQFRRLELLLEILGDEPIGWTHREEASLKIHRTR